MEHWKPVVGFENCYSVSDQGNVVRTGTYGSKPKKKWKACAPRIKRGGYITFHLCKNGRTSDPFAHRLVWEAFKGAIPDGFEIDHKNNKRDDNRLCNLQLVTKSQNATLGFRRDGRPPPNNPSPGSKNGSAKLTDADIPAMIHLYRGGMTQRQIGEQFGVSPRCISLIIRGETWGHIERPHLRLLKGERRVFAT